MVIGCCPLAAGAASTATQPIATAASNPFIQILLTSGKSPKGAGGARRVDAPDIDGSLPDNDPNQSGTLIVHVSFADDNTIIVSVRCTPSIPFTVLARKASSSR